MPTQEELITAFRKETEDLVQAMLIQIFLIKYGELSAVVGDNPVSFTGDAYDSATDYTIRIVEALDGEGIDVRGELNIKDKTANGFKISAVRPCSIKWQTGRNSPKINFHT
jgi:hypothetical protein